MPTGMKRRGFRRGARFVLYTKPTLSLRIKNQCFDTVPQRGLFIA